MNQSLPKVSVIMPLYKCAAFLSEALDSVLGQSFYDTEIICVLDGPDAEMQQLIEARAQSDERLFFLVQEHGGAGAARNAGLAKARGEYLLFLDADDLFSPDLIKRLYETAKAKDADVVMCTYSQENGWTRMVKTGSGVSFASLRDGEAMGPAEVENLYRSFIGAPWNKLFRRQLILDHGLRFSQTRIMNDEYFVCAAITYAKRLVAIKEDLLKIRRYVNPDSISSNRAKYLEDSLLVLDQIYQMLRQSGTWEKRREEYYEKFLDTFHYHSIYDYNDNYVEELARTLSRKEPWKSMCNAELFRILKLDLRRMERIRQMREDECAALEGVVDISGRKELLRMEENRLRVAKELRLRMKEKYGRDLMKRDNPFAWISWSLKARGFYGTMQSIRLRRGGDRIIEINGMLCAGHLSTAGHYIDCFLPMDVQHEHAEVMQLSVVVRLNGYYPFAVSGAGKEVLTPLGPQYAQIYSGGTSQRPKEIRRIVATVHKGQGIMLQIRFTEALLKNRKKDPANNNHPISAIIKGKIRLII